MYIHIKHRNTQTNNVLFGQYHSRADVQSISKYTDIHPIHNKLWETWLSQVGQYKFTACK